MILANEPHAVIDAIKIGGTPAIVAMIIAFAVGYNNAEHDWEKASTGLTYAAIWGTIVMLLVAGGYLAR